jgi:CheY-like chemotaxis protein
MSEVVGGQASSTVGQSVLLVDVNLRRRESRAAHLRKLGAVVDCASNATTALQKFGATTYRLVLIDLERAAAEQLAGEIRLKDPKQLVGFMVEGPTLISKTLAAARVTNTIAKKFEPEPQPEQSAPTESAFGMAVRKAEESQQS